MPRLQQSQEEVEVMRSRLSLTALEVYRREGLSALSFRRIAEAAGISHTLPYRYFDNKEALLARMRADALSRFESYVREYEERVEGALEKVQSIAEGYLAFARELPEDYMLIFATEQPSPEQYPDVLAARCRVFDHVVDAVQRCVECGDLQGNAREISHHVWVALHGLLSLHTADQLVHGMALEEIVGPLLQRLLAAHRAVG
ncbi:TetR/AcrR family transcriptional regulator [Spongiibacter sp. KMU-166]|uniref:TetR/AcrR family transcriptional regulator n=1 Tax=Spongiibacter thalassae TaxID=2721624 RepID=A0ABX1GAM7_9GAMM|nr:TetR/AcrR family transcriptional regulator [Spongiibacter thalassae]NKI16020.1 TetR/AcrR family transcriptional regulator [Spongiibacter thalassae]